MAATLVRKVMLQIAADDGDTEEKLGKISQKADELADKHPELKVRIDTAAASAKLAVLRRELKDTGDESVDAKTRLGAFGEALNSGLLGGIGGGIGEMTMFQKVMMGLNVATGLGEPLVAGLTVAVGGLSSGLVAAGAGLGVFGLTAKSVWSQYSSNISAAAAAQEKIASGDTGAKLAADNKALAASFKGLHGNVLAMVMGAANAETSWHQFTTGAAQGVAGVLAPALQLVPSLLGQAQKFLGPVEKALRGIVSMVGQQLSGKGFSSFMSMLAANSGPAITKLGGAIDHIAAGIGGIIRAFMPFAQDMLSGLDKITGAFAKWGSTLSQHTGFQSLISTFKSETPKAVGVLKNLAVVIKNVVSAMTGMSTFSNSKMLLQVLGPLSGILARLSKNTDLVRIGLYLLAAADAGKKLRTAFQGIQGTMGIFKTGASALQDLRAGFSNSAAAASDATGIWGTFGGKISTAITAVKGWGIWSKVAAAATKVWTGIQAAFDAIMDANPIALVVIAVAALVAAIVICAVKFQAFRDFWKDAWKDIKAAFDAAFGWIKSHWELILAILIGPIGLAVLAIKDNWKRITDACSEAIGWIKSHWPLLLAILAGPIGLATLFIVDHWRQILSGAQHMLDSVVSFFRSLPGRIASALANLGSMMFNAGVHAIESLIGGIGSMIGKLGSVMGGIAAKVAGFIGLSPAKEGPLSGGGAPEIRGQHIAADIAKGMTSGLPRIGTAAARLAGAAALGAAASPAIAGAGGGRLQVEWVGGQSDQQFLTWIKRNIRIRGGDVDNMGR